MSLAGILLSIFGDKRNRPPSWQHLPESLEYTFKYIGHTSKFILPNFQYAPPKRSSNGFSNAIQSFISNTHSATKTEFYSYFKNSFETIWILWEMMVFIKSIKLNSDSM